MHNKAFTLVELIVWITISMLLMVSVGILLSSWVQNILKQEKIISQSTNFWENISQIYKNFENIQWEHIYSSNNGILFRVKQNINTGGFWYLWSVEKTWEYCPIDSELNSTQHLTWKNFIPYEEIWEDFLVDFDNTQTSQVWNIRVDTLNHQILENGIKILWWESYGYTLNSSGNTSDVLLNTPTWIVQAEWGFFLSDTLNHRILFYKDGNVSLVLDHYDGLIEPTWLAYENGTLYIANSWKWEILTYSSRIYTTNPELQISYIPENTYGTFNRIEIWFTWEDSITLSWPSSTGSYSFDENYISQDEDYARIHNNNLQYFFSDFWNSSSLVSNGNIPSCNQWSQYNVTASNRVEKLETSCASSNTGSIIRYTWNTNFSLWNGNKYEININNISPTFSNSGNYLAEVSFYENNTLKNQKVFHYFTQWTGNVSDSENNTLEIFAENLWYPTWLSIDGTNLLVNDSLNRTQHRVHLVNKIVSTHTSLNDFSDNWFEQLEYNPMTDTFLEFPIKNIEIQYNSSNKYLGWKIDYYQFINCYNPDEKIEKSFLFGKNMK